MLSMHYPVTQAYSKGMTMAVFTDDEWAAIRVAVNRVAVSDEPSDDRAHEVWRHCKLLAAEMHG